MEGSRGATTECLKAACEEPLERWKEKTAVQDALKQGWCNVGPPSATLAQRYSNFVSMCRGLLGKRQSTGTSQVNFALLFSTEEGSTKTWRRKDSEVDGKEDVEKVESSFRVGTVWGTLPPWQKKTLNKYRKNINGKAVSCFLQRCYSVWATWVEDISFLWQQDEVSSCRWSSTPGDGPRWGKANVGTMPWQSKHHNSSRPRWRRSKGFWLQDCNLSLLVADRDMSAVM